MNHPFMPTHHHRQPVFRRGNFPIRARTRLTAGLLSLPLVLGLVLSFPLASVAAPSAAPVASATALSSAVQSDAENLNTASANTRSSHSAVRYAYPSGAKAVDLYLDGKQVLSGACVAINGEVYVAAERFINLFGNFTSTYRATDESLTVNGKNLSITLRVGDPYITVNGRILYTNTDVLSLRGWIFAPLSSLTKALNADAWIRLAWYDAYVSSGDVTAVPSASSVYNETDLYWLSRIISAEARGEPLEGQIAVGNVVLNRVRSSEFPNTVKGVIFDKIYGIQFSPVANGSIYNTPTESAVLAAKICLEGYTFSTRALYFYNPAIATSSWIGRTRPYIMTIGNHAFYG